MKEIINKKLNGSYFKCHSCGFCCSWFGRSNTLPVFEFEIPQLEMNAKKQGIDLIFVPENVLLDKKSGNLFCLNYGMAIMPCPFLIKSNKNNLCSIYKKRPLICRKFPLEKNPLFHKIKKGIFFDCPNLDPNKAVEKLKQTGCLNKENKKYKNKIKEKSIEIFGKEIWDASLSVDRLKSEINNKIKELENLGKIEICFADWVDVKKHKIMGVFEFLEKYESLKIKTKYSDFVFNKGGLSEVVYNKKNKRACSL